MQETEGIQESVTTSIQETNNKKVKKDTSSILNQKLDLNSTFFKKFSIYYQNRVPYQDELDHQAQILTYPYLAGSIDSVLDPKFVARLIKEIESFVPLNKLDNDLYSFYQSKDLTHLTTKNITKLRTLFKSSQFIDLFRSLTGLPLIDGKVDLSISKYSYDNYLLCHDDDIKSNEDKEGRRIAFILYLVDEDWNEEDGGELELFPMDSNNEPSYGSTVKLVPKRNRLVFFEIGNNSYHQVLPVKSKVKDRLSIVGWFHGKIEDDSFLKGRRQEEYKFLQIVKTDKLFDLKEIINGSYLSEENINQIATQFHKDGSLSLTQFFTEEFFTKLTNEIYDGKLTFFSNSLGPPTLRNYKKMLATEGPTANQLFDLIESIEFQALVAKLTNYEIKSVAHNINKFEDNGFKILNDKHLDPNGIDLLIYFLGNDVEWESKWYGGYHYLDKETCKTTVYPNHNTLNLIDRRTEDTLRFIKLIRNPKNTKFCMLDCIFK